MTPQLLPVTAPMAPRHREVGLRALLHVAVCLLAFLALPATVMATETPVAAYSFDESEGGSAGDSASNHDATLHGPVWIKAGRYGAALEFNGEGDYLSVPDSGALDLTAGITLEAWVHPTATEAWATIIEKGHSNEEMPYGYALFLQGEEGTPTLGLAESNAVDAHINAESSLLPDTWTHIAVSSDGEEARLYVDGELDGSGPALPVWATDGDLRIGGSQSLAGFEGLIDELRVYDRVLTDEEIREDMYTAIDPASGASTTTVLAQGPLVEGGEEELVSPESPLQIEATDEGGSIAQVSLLLDGRLEQVVNVDLAVAEGASRGCEEGLCSFTHELRPAFNNATPGPHTLSVRATNEAGYSATESYPVKLDATAPELSMSGSLAEANGSALEGEAGTLKISVSDGNGGNDSGVGHITILVDGNITKSEPFPCESGCPEPAMLEYVYEESEWGVGPHEVEVRTSDLAGNEATGLVLVNADRQAIFPACTSKEPAVVGAGTTATTEEAKSQIELLAPSVLLPNVDEIDEDPDAVIDPHLVSSTYGTSEGKILEMAETAQGGYIEDQIAGGFTIANAGCLSAARTTTQETTRSVVPGTPTVVSANTATETDTAIRAMAMGSAVVHSFRGSAPLTMTWNAALRPEHELVEVSSGAVALLDPTAPDVPPREGVSSPEGDPSSPGSLNDVDLHHEAALYDSWLANNELEGEVIGVLPRPTVVDAEGTPSPVSLSVGEGGDELTASIPTGTKVMILRTESAVEPLAMCATAFAGSAAYAEGCRPDSDAGEAYERLWVDNGSWTSGGDFVYTAWAPGGEEAAELPQIFATSPSGETTALAIDEFEWTGRPVPSPDGEFITFDGCSIGYVECGIFLMKTDGTEVEHIELSEEVGFPTQPSFSADQARIYFVVYSSLEEYPWQSADLYSVKTDGSQLRRVTKLAEPVTTGMSQAAATPDGDHIVIGSVEELIRIPSSAENADWSEVTVLRNDIADFPVVSPDSKHVLYRGRGEIRQVGIDGEGDEQVVPYAASEYAPIAFSFSPNGAQISMVHRGNMEVMPASGGSGTTVIPAEDALPVSSTIGRAAPEVQLKIEGLDALMEPFFISEYPGSDIKAAEREFCEEEIGRLLECGTFYADRARAYSMRERIFTNRDAKDISTRGNAFLHGFWTALMVKSSKNFSIYKGQAIPNGLHLAIIHEGPLPYSWDSKMDYINDLVGSTYWELEGGPEVSEEDVCEAFRIKGKNAIFIGARISPFEWEKGHSFHFRRVIFRKQRSNYGSGSIVKPNGRTCYATW